MPNLVSQTFSSPCVLDKIQARVFSISNFLVRFLKHRNSDNSRTSNNINLRLGPISKLKKTNTMGSNKILKTIYEQFMTYLTIFGLTVDLEQTRSCIMDIWSIFLRISSVTTVDLTKTGNRIKESLRQPWYYSFEKGTFCPKMINLCKIIFLRFRGCGDVNIFFGTTYVFTNILNFWLLA